jgi:hypothetical protein
MAVVDIAIHAIWLPHDDPDACLASFRDTPGFEVRNQGRSNGAACRDLEGTIGAADR